MIELERSVGVFLPIPSLPSPLGIGDLGPAAYRFAEQLARAGVRYWQILPWGPTEPGLDNSPYNALSAFAGNPLWISPELLYAEGFCRRQELQRLRRYTPRIDYRAVMVERGALLEQCFENRQRWRRHEAAFEEFCHREAAWLESWTLYALLREQHRGMPWYRWERPYRQRSSAAVQEYARRCAARLRFHAWVQYLFFRQLEQLRQWCWAQGVELIGDMPLFIAYDSADVWASPERFLLSPEGELEFVAGAPPDGFNPEGQRWGQPLYRWDFHREEGFAWWQQRVEHLLRFVRWVRLDHFRGYSACWAIPASAATAAEGSWMPAPGQELLRKLQQRWMPLPLLPEDLGTITPDVELLRQRFGLSSMRVLLFAFPQPGRNPHAPHLYTRDCVAYTSLHDTPPLRGWLEHAPQEVRHSVVRYGGKSLPARQLVRELVRLVFQSAAWLVVVAVQDLCALGAEARLNIPGTSAGNWTWRLPPGMPRQAHWDMLAEMCVLYGRGR